MDILGGMSNSTEGQQVYLAFKTADQQFFVNGKHQLILNTCS